MPASNAQVNKKGPQVLALRAFRELPGQDSNLDKEIQRASSPWNKPLSGDTLGQTLSQFAHGFAQTDPDLARVLDAWPYLSDPLRRANPMSWDRRPGRSRRAS